MRILFNHGLTAGELYTNTPKHIIDKPWRWMIKHYGHSSSHNDAIADPFRYCFGLILNKIIDEKVRFKFPYNTDAYIDFDIITGDKFIKQRQNGRFQEIDFVESDFTGYFLNYYYNTKSYQRAIPIYIGGELKQKFLNGINSGEKYYSIKDVTINDFVDDVQKVFNQFTVLEIKNILNHGFRRFYTGIKYGCNISIISRKYIQCLAFIGNLTLTPEKNIKEYSLRKDRKLRRIYKWNKPEFDGYYYIGLSGEGFEKWLYDNKDSRTISVFNNIMSRRIKDELYYKNKQVHIFRYKIKKFKGYNYWIDNLKIKNLEYLGEAIERKFYPSNKTWQILKKEENEKRSNQ